MNLFGKISDYFENVEKQMYFEEKIVAEFQNI